MGLNQSKAVTGILVAVLTATGAGAVANHVFAPVIPAKAGYVVQVADAGAGAGAGGGAALTPAQFAALVEKSDVAAGEKVAKKCAACHQLQQGGGNGVGPALWGVVGRGIAAHEGYTYSDALKAKSSGKWDVATLNEWLQGPQSFAKGTKMQLAIGKDEDRAALIAYLKTLK